MNELREASAVDASHLTGVTYAAVQTSVYRGMRGDLIGLACDGNGRSTTVTGIDADLGLVAQHLQVLQAHHESTNVRDYVPGYMDAGNLADERKSSTIVWVLV